MRCNLTKTWMAMALAASVLIGWPGLAWSETVPTFEDLGLEADAFWNGSDLSGGFTSGGLEFANVYVEDPFMPFWCGWAYSSKTDTTSAQWTNQYSAITGSGAGGSAAYGVAYYSGWPVVTIPTVTIPSGQEVPEGLYVTNTTYAYYSMKVGDAFSTPFTDTDWQKLTITGKSGDVPVGSVDCYLAEGRDILDDWKWVGLESLQGHSVTSLEFTFTGSKADFVPSYVAVDAVPEPSSILLIASASVMLLAGRRRWAKSRSN